MTVFVPLWRLFLIMFAVATFAAAALFSSVPMVLPQPVPDAQDVGIARSLGRTVINGLRSPGVTAVAVGADQLPSLGRVASYGNRRISAVANLSDAGGEGHASLRLAQRTWLNVSAHGRTYAPGEPPDLSARVGSYALPPGVSRWIAARAIDYLWQGDSPAPTLSDVLPAARFDSRYAVASYDVPLDLLSGVQKLTGRSSPEAGAEARATYLRLTTFAMRLDPKPPMGRIYAQAFAAPPAPGSLSPEEATGRLVGILMASFNPEFLRLVDAQAMRLPPSRPEARFVTIAVRRDLPLHFTFSAVIAATSDLELGSALGELKELGDSLAGGSGFSFVDLAADRAGLRLGKLLADPATTARTQRLLAVAEAGDLFPAEALGLTEGLTEEDFRARFGKIDSARYEQTVAEIDAALDALPIYAPQR